MVNGCASAALRQVARVFHDGTFTGLTDRQILERFVDRRDEAAFEALLMRHGPMVLNVCRQLLRDPHDVEDAFQAVFLVLVRKAGSVRVDVSLGPWLYTVASRVAARARAVRRRVRARELSGGMLPESPALDRLDCLELPGVIHQELGRLPERLRAPLVLCYLEGLTHELAARQLGWPVGTVRSRLARGRGLLQRRMTRRGLALSAATVGSMLESNARAAVVPHVVRMSLIKILTQGMSEAAAKGGLGVSTSVGALLEGVLNVMRIKKLAILATVSISLGALGYVIAQRAAAVGQTGPRPTWQAGVHFDPRPIGPDGRRIGALPAKSELPTLTKTYYIGDLLSPRKLRGPVTLANGVGMQPKVDMTPMIDLITSTVAPGTWRAPDEAGIEVSSRIAGRGSVETKEPGSITPFYLSYSLIIRCTPETHDEIAGLMRRLRKLVFAEGEEEAKIDPAAVPTKVTQPPVPGDAPLPPPFAQPAAPSGSGTKARVQKLLNELTKEIDKLPRSGD